MSRPIGASYGAFSLGIAWLVTGAFAILTGASAVVILLAIGLVAFAAGVLSGWAALRGVQVVSLATTGLTEEGEEVSWRMELAGAARVFVELRISSAVVASGWFEPGVDTLAGTAPSRGIHHTVAARCTSAGRLGLVWWRRTSTIEIAPLAVAPAPADHGAPFTTSSGAEHDEVLPSAATGRDEVDGIRQWRDGDELTAVHWPSTLRSGEFVVRQRRKDTDERWVVQARTGTGDPDLEAAMVRHSLERGLAAGARLAVRVDDGAANPLAGRDSMLRWSAAFEPRPDVPSHDLPWWRRSLALLSPEPERSLTPTARWFVALAAATPLVMLLEPLGYGPVPLAVVVAVVALGAFFTQHGPDHRKWLRQVCGLLAGAGVAAALIDPNAIHSVANSLRFLLPQVLVTLMVMQGFECTDRRSARVALACSAMLTSYAAGIRVDGTLAAWLGVAVLGLAAGSRAVARVDHRLTSTSPSPPRKRARAGTRSGIALVAAAAAVLAILALLPVPEGPAQLTLPSWLEDYRPIRDDGGLVAADGSPLLGGAAPGGDRTGPGGSGGYPGFSPAMDTSLRGGLGNEVVLRVRAPYPDFWRGQTFSDFDGRVWRVDDATGVLTDPPEHVITAATGDVDASSDDQFVQTFYAQVDLPNIVFAASRAERVLLDAKLWARPDGALRADVVLPAGSAYTVVSQRSGATAAGLRDDGDLAKLGSPAEFTALPAGTTPRTRALAASLAAGTTSTYDVILAIQGWLRQHVTYDLDAPVPPEGADAVDHFLFESRQGFCEQIATATAILLRTLGVPARIATGYVPGERDEVAGVWLSRASDAHAWVEVRFPSFGWVAFDPTASVPLAGEAERSTIGGDLAKAIARAVSDHLALVLSAALASAALVLAARVARGWWQRRRRGRWGVLQDRFLVAAVQRGGDPRAPNEVLAEVFDGADAQRLAAALDASAFSSGWTDDDDAYRHGVALVGQLEQ
ncbi:MAG: transglutaminaseTgpA domain-containing protein [Ilumatobacteraceae bacterium]